MDGRFQVGLRTMVMVGVVGTLLLADLVGAQAETPKAAPQAANACDSWPPCCALGVQNPSIDDDGDVVTSLRWDCNFQPLYETLRLELRKNGVVVDFDTVSYTRYDDGGTGHIRMYASEDCSSGSWQAEATAWYPDYWGWPRVTVSTTQARSLTCAPPPPPTTRTTTTTTTRPTTTTTRPCPNPPRCHPD
jgi:hypothetical protein